MTNKVLLYLFQLILVIMILIGGWSYVNSNLSRIGFAKNFYARDISLNIDTLYAPPGNLAYSYSINEVYPREPGKHYFDIEIAEEILTLNATDSKDKVFYWHFTDLNMQPVEYKVEDELGFVRFIKEGDEIKIGKDVYLEPMIMSCARINTENKAWKAGVRVILDPVHGKEKSDIGDYNPRDNTFTEEFTMLNLAKSAGFNLKKGKNKIITRDESDGLRYISDDDRLKKIKDGLQSDDIIIRLATGYNKDASVNMIKAYYNANSDKMTRIKSSKLGCSILNSIITYEQLDGRNTITGIMMLPTYDKEKISMIPSTNVGVYLEMGNMQIPKSSNFISDTTDLAEAIYSGIGGGYYG